MQNRIDSKDILQLFSGKNLSGEESQYLRYHARRLAYTITLVQRFIDQHHARRILDIGPHFLTFCLAKLLKPQPDISTLGFADGRLFPPELASKHFQGDLNECASMEINASDANFDLITFCETIEHLYTSPKIILSFLSKLLKQKPGAGILIQTPNAASFSKRIRLLLGDNPFELIREERKNPGHFREYTMKELEDYVFEAGFEIWFRQYCSYWPGSGLLDRLVNVCPSLRGGITMFVVRP